jgi:hypothetical protein
MAALQARHAPPQGGVLGEQRPRDVGQAEGRARIVRVPR